MKLQYRELLKKKRGTNNSVNRKLKEMITSVY